MKPEQKERWDEANRMEREHPGNPFVLENAIRIRQEIIQQLQDKVKQECGTQ